MSAIANHLGQPLSVALPGWRPPPRPARAVMRGRWCRLEPLDPRTHAAALFAAHAEDREGRNWTYLPYGPFASVAEYTAWMEEAGAGNDPVFFAVMDHTGSAVGVSAYLRIDPANGSIEAGHIHFSPRLQGTTAATEAMFLMMRHVFEAGYRRYEWKCHSLNAPSRAAAMRLGFSFEGIFRQAAVVKGRNRDTAWFAMIDSEWPALRKAYEQWLDPANFDARGQQRARLSDLTRACVQPPTEAQK